MLASVQGVVAQLAATQATLHAAADRAGRGWALRITAQSLSLRSVWDPGTGCAWCGDKMR